MSAMQIVFNVVAPFVSLLFGAGVAWGVVKNRMNKMEKDIDNLFKVK